MRRRRRRLRHGTCRAIVRGLLVAVSAAVMRLAVILFMEVWLAGRGSVWW